MIEKQPRGLGDEAMFAKVNEIIAKANKAEERIAALETGCDAKSNAALLAALNDADDAIQRAIAYFSREVI